MKLVILQSMKNRNENAKRNDDDAMMNTIMINSVILQSITNSKKKANEGISEKDKGRSGSSASQKCEGKCENLSKNLFKEELSREAGFSSDLSQILLKPRHSAMIRQNLLWLQRGLDRALRIEGSDEMSEEDKEPYKK